MSTATTDLPDLILLTQPAQPPPAKMADPKDAETCPVDHKAREAWLQHARAAAPNDAATPPAPPHPIPNQTPPPTQSWTQSLLSYTPFSGTTSQTTPTAGADACPVDHKSREAWLQQARAANAAAARLAAAAGGRAVLPVEANELFVRLDEAEAAALRARGFDFYDWGEGEARFVTAWDQPAAEVAALAEVLAAL